MTGLEFDIELERVVAETKVIIAETKHAAKLAIDQLTAMLDLALSERQMLIDVVRAAGDAQTIRDVDNLLKALPSRFAHLKSDVQTLQ